MAAARELRMRADVKSASAGALAEHYATSAILTNTYTASGSSPYREGSSTAVYEVRRRAWFPKLRVRQSAPLIWAATGRRSCKLVMAC